MNRASRTVACGLLLFASTSIVAETKTLTGKVTCSMCRGKHEMGIADDAECARKCVKNGAKYVFISGDEMYRLEGDPKQLEYYAEKNVTIRGEVDQGRIVKIEAISVVK
jgi:hypothetical protein